MEILGIIPSRGGSKGLPGKNIRDLLGRPLISYTINEAKNSKCLSRVIVTTDSPKIAGIAREYGAEAPFLRPAELATDSASTVDAVIHAVQWLEENENYNPDYVCVMQCTSPLTKATHIDGAIMKLIDSGLDGAASICESEVNPYWMQIFKGDRLQYLLPEGKYITRRQDLPPVYRMNGAIYLVKTEVLLSKRTLEPENMTGYVMRGNESIDIDTEADFLLVENILKSKVNHEENCGCDRDKS